MADKLREEFDRGLEKTDAEVGKMRESVAKLDAKVAGIVAGISIIVSIIVNVIIYLLKKG